MARRPWLIKEMQLALRRLLRLLRLWALRARWELHRQQVLEQLVPLEQLTLQVLEQQEGQEFVVLQPEQQEQLRECMEQMVRLEKKERALWEQAERMNVTVKWGELKALSNLKAGSKGEDWATFLGWFIPRKYRAAVLGDILEDCVEMRAKGCSERRIRLHVIYQWLIAVVTLVPTAAKAWIADLIRKVTRP